MPTHHARATQIASDTGCPASNARMVFTIAVTGWCSAKTRTVSGIDLVGTNAELIKGRKISGYCHLSDKKCRPSDNVPRCQALSAACLCHIIWPDIIFFFRSDFSRLFGSVFWSNVKIYGGSA